MKLAGLKGRIPVEPLDDERLTNIERRIVAGADVAPAPHRSGLALVFAAAVVVVVGAGFAGWQLRGGGSKPTAIAAQPMHVNMTEERSTIDIGDATIESDPLTDYTITRPDGGVLVAMTRGKVELQVGKRGDRAPLVVAAGDTRVIVVGTRFSVDYGDGTGDVEVRVTEGVVRVERLSKEVRVAAGEAWTSKQGAVVAGVALPKKKRVIAMPPDVLVEAPTDSVEIKTEAPDVLHDRAAQVPDAKLPVPTQPAAKRPTGPELTARPSTPGTGSATGATLDLFALVRKQELLAPLDLGVRPEESIAKYKDIESKKFGEEASLAHYSRAYMEAFKLGRTADALSTLDLYMRRYNGGKESHSWASFKAALWLRVRILCTKTLDDRCRQAAFTYMHEASGTPAAHVAEAITLSPR